jgi:hypothetical protein
MPIKIMCPTTRRTYAASLALAPEAVRARSPSLRGRLHPARVSKCTTTMATGWRDTPSQPVDVATPSWPADMIPVTGQRGTTMPRPRALAFIAKEFREMVPPTLFFLVGFNLIVLTGHLLVNDYRMQLFNYMVATTTALVVGKSVLLANALPFLRRFDGVPLIAPILFKTLVYCTAVLIVRFVEELVEYWISGGSLSGTLRHVREEFAWHRFAAVQIWIFVLFLVYTTATELAELLGNGELRRSLFGRSDVDPKLTHHQRVQTCEKPRDRTGSAEAEQCGGVARNDLQTDLRVRSHHALRGAP